jgi:hypothetical protein
MGFFEILSVAPANLGLLRKRSTAKNKSRAFPRIELLEARRLLSTCATISGFVYHDANNNGLFDPGETPIANSLLELHDATGQLVATTTTDANGAYVFATDSRIDTSDAIKDYTVNFPDRTTDWTDTRSLPQFDPALGTLRSIEIRTTDPITSTVRLENVDTAAATIHALVNGTATLSGPSLASLVTTLRVEHSFAAAPFDGTIDFMGPSGHTYGPEITPGSNDVTLTSASDLAPYMGTGQVTFTESTLSNSSASGSANLVLSVNTSVAASVEVIYHYTPSNCLKKGDYTIMQPTLPPGYLNGLKTSGNITPIPGSDQVNYIHVTLGMTNLTNNNFGERLPGTLSGYVYFDANNNGVKDPGEQGIAAVPVSLSGFDDQGNVVNITLQTAVDGSYKFTNLRAGVYTITEGGTTGYLDGKDTIGTQGGTVGADQFTNIKLGFGVNGVNNNFGELKPSSLSGFCYYDANNDGIKEPGEPGIANVKITLTGVDDRGNAVNQTQFTAADGSYSFTNLRPGTYQLNEFHPVGYLDGKDTIGTQGGVTSHDQFSNINLASGVNGTDNDFGELLPAAHTTPTPPRPPLGGKQYFLASRAFRSFFGS